MSNNLMLKIGRRNREAILKYLQENEPATIHDLRFRLGFGHYSTHRHLRMLVEMGLVASAGHAPKRGIDGRGMKPLLWTTTEKLYEQGQTSFDGCTGDTRDIPAPEGVGA